MSSTRCRTTGAATVISFMRAKCSAMCRKTARMALSSLQFRHAGTRDIKMRKFKVTMVVNDHPPTPDWVVRRLTEQGIDLVQHICKTGAEVASVAADADVVWMFGGSRIITPEVLPHLQRCRAIVRAGTGTDDL